MSDTSDGAPGQPLEARSSNRSHSPNSSAFREFISRGWAMTESTGVTRAASADAAYDRRAAVSDAFPGERLVIPAGPLKVRSNDTDYRFRPHTAFAHLTGLGMDREPDAVLVIEPNRDATLFFRPRAGFDTEEFYSDSRYGEFWVGPRPSVADLETETGLSCRHIDELCDALAKDVGTNGMMVRIVPHSDPAIEQLVAELRAAATVDGVEAEKYDAKLAEVLSELRLVKDAYAIDQMREAVAISIRGFEDIVRNLARAAEHERGERVIEGVFEARARAEGNGLGYDTIAASGAHACILHWIRNDGPVRDDDLVLIDAGAEADSLYTADITRTLPVSGTFSPVQRKVYEAVLEAADAAFKVARPGVTFRKVHEAAMAVIAHKLAEWGLLPVTAEESLSAEGGQHRRWMVHGTSHHLGLDVHDCAQARREMYVDKMIEPGMVFTIEPGLYFHPNDTTVPPEYRGIGVRIEDDVLITEDGNESLTRALPRTVDDVEAWMASLRA